MDTLLPDAFHVGPRVRMATVQVDELIRLGKLDDADHCEVLDGALIEMPPVGPDHPSLTDILARMLTRGYGDAAFVRCGNPIDAGAYSRPQPDLSVVAGRPEDFRGRVPRGDEALLVIEVSVSTLIRDHAKGLLYAQAGVPVYWVVDRDGRRVEVYEDPTDEGYRRVTFSRLGDFVSPPGTTASWNVAGLLGVERCGTGAATGDPSAPWINPWSSPYPPRWAVEFDAFVEFVHCECDVDRRELHPLAYT